jgi:hypothetical protein
VSQASPARLARDVSSDDVRIVKSSDFTEERRAPSFRILGELFGKERQVDWTAEKLQREAERGGSRDMHTAASRTVGTGTTSV